MTVTLFFPYLYFQEFKLRTDHALLLWFCKRIKPFLQIKRSFEFLVKFDFELEHRAETMYRNVDGLGSCTKFAQCGRVKNRDDGTIQAELVSSIRK